MTQTSMTTVDFARKRLWSAAVLRRFQPMRKDVLDSDTRTRVHSQRSTKKGHSDFVIVSAFEIRHSSFDS